MPVTGINAVIADQQRRGLKATPVEIISLNGKIKDRDLLAVGAGSLNVFVAPKGSGFVEKAKAAVAGGDAAFMEFLKPLVAQYTKKRTALTVDAMAKAMLKEPVLADVRYGGERLAAGIFVPKGFAALPISLPYNGGPVLTKGLELVEHTKDGVESGYEAIALKIDPVLSEAEAAALKAVPKDQWAKNIGASASCETTYVAVAVVAVTLVAAFTVGAAGAATVTTTLAVKVKDIHIKDEVIKSIGPAASARMLVDLRRKAMQVRNF